MVSTANIFAYIGVSWSVYTGYHYAMDTYTRQSAGKYVHVTTQAPPSLINTDTCDATKTNGLLNDLERLRQDQSDTISSNDCRRMNALKDKFHDKLAESLQTALEKRPIDIAECRSRYDVDVAFREGLERGSTLALARLAMGLRDYHAEGTNPKLKKTSGWPYYPEPPAFKIPGTGKEMLEQLPKQID